MLASPIFMVGSVRSGTTLLRLMLDHHPDIAFEPESEFIVDYLPDGTTQSDMERYYERLAVDRNFQESGYSIDRTLDYAQLVDSFLVQRLHRDPKPVIGATVHTNFHRLRRIWPDARYIHIRRDGRDVARSCVQMGWAGNVWTGAQAWIDAERLWADLRPLIPRWNRLEVTYERLIQDAPTTLRGICAFIGVPYSERMFDYATQTTYSLPDPGLIGQWRTRLSTHEVQMLEARIGDMLLERDYPLSGLPRIEVTPQMLRALRRSDRVRKVQFRVLRYGLFLWSQDFLSRRLRIRAWQNRVRLCLNAIDVLHLK